MDTPQNPFAVRGSLVAIGCVVIALAGMLIPSAPTAAPSSAKAPPAPAAPLGQNVSTAWPAGAEPRVTFASTMPRAQGAQVFNNNGTPNLAMVMVAIPDGPKGVRFVRGTDPAAIRYLAAAREEQERLVLDNGPANIDTGEIANLGPLKGRTKRRVHLGADGK